MVKTMKIFMLHVGDPIEDDIILPEEACLWMTCFNDCTMRRYLKKDIINSTSQMRSIIKCGVEVEYGFLTGRRSIIKLLKAGLRLRRKVKYERIEVVHVLWGSTSSLMAVMFSPVPVPVSFSGSDLFGVVDHKTPKNLLKYVNVIISQISGVFARKIIVKSNEMLQLLWSVNQRKCAVIPNGVDMDLFYPMDRDVARYELSWHFNKKIILFFTGGGAAVKDSALAEAAFSYVKERLPDSEMVKVENIPHERLHFYYNAADALLMTSLHEGSNNSMKEAMCCNLPIVSVNCGDAKERLHDVGQCYVANNRSAKMLGDCLIKVLTSNRRSNGREHIQELSLENVANKIIDIYKSLVIQK